MVVPAPSTDINVKQDNFARLVVELGSLSAAYAQAYGRSTLDCRPDASNLARVPAVAARIAEYRAVARAASVTSLEERIAELEAMLDADDPAELCVFGCRHCATGRYQYANAAELAQRLDAYLASATSPKPLPFPSDAVGPVFGFTPWAPVNGACSSCMGAGVPVVRHHDTRTLSAGARRMLKGIKQKDGEITVETIDKLAVRRLLHELRGDIVRKSDVRSVNLNATLPDVSHASPDDVLQMWKASQRRSIP